MRAVFRFGNVLLAGALALAPAIAVAQQAPPTDSSTPAADAIGPKELQNFSLNGTVTRPSDQPVAVSTAPQKRQPRAQAQVARPAVEPSTSVTDSANSQAAPAAPTQAPPSSRTASAQVPQAAAPQPSRDDLQQTAPASSVTVALPKLDASSGTASAGVAPAPSTDFAPAPGTLAPEHSFPILPWLLAALVLGAGAAFLFWRKQQQQAAFAGGPQVDAFVAPEPPPAPAPRPAPAPPPKSPAPKPAGIVSTRLRPWIDIGFQPLRCILDDERLTVEFELELFNSGSAPARAVLVEATLFNAGPAQDQQIGNFFASPVGEGERIVVIPPLKRVGLKTQVVAAREQLQAYELAGRQVFVPIIAFNSLYSWSGGEGQTSASYLLGKDTKGEKMGPFRLDLGPRIFRGVAAHVLPTGVRN
jgi:hypothetical protein